MLECYVIELTVEHKVERMFLDYLPTSVCTVALHHTAAAVPGAPCGPTDYKCVSGNQCVPSSYQCDDETDCDDRSDEIGCGEGYFHFLVNNMFSTD